MEIKLNRSDKNILITGGFGFIGSHVVRQLLNHKFRLVLLKKKSSNMWRIKHLLKDINIIDVDLNTDFSSIIKHKKINGIIHLAGTHIKINKTSDDIKLLNESNITFPSLLLEAAVKNNVHFFINTGSFSEYRLTGRLSENSAIQPYNYYSATKVAFESILKYYALQFKIRAVTLKLFSPYGEGDNEKIITLLSKSFISNKRLALTKGNQKLCFTYVGDIVNAYMKAMSFVVSNKYRKYEDFNIGSNESFSIQKIVRLIQDISKKQGRITFDAVKILNDEKTNIKCNTSKAKKMLQWQPKVSIVEGIRNTYTYCQNESNNDKRS